MALTSAQCTVMFSTTTSTFLLPYNSGCNIDNILAFHFQRMTVCQDWYTGVCLVSHCVVHTEHKYYPSVAVMVCELPVIAT